MFENYNWGAPPFLNDINRNKMIMYSVTTHKIKKNILFLNADKNHFFKNMYMI